jgi:ATP-dependent DNA ligase
MSYPGLGAVRSGTIRYATSRSFTLACWEIGCWAVRLPEPMLLRSGRLPTGDYAYEPKWNGFRALVSRSGHLRVKSRRSGDMTSLLPELTGLPDRLAVDGELVAFGATACQASPGSASGCSTASGAST